MYKNFETKKYRLSVEVRKECYAIYIRERLFNNNWVKVYPSWCSDLKNFSWIKFFEYCGESAINAYVDLNEVEQIKSDLIRLDKLKAFS